jgi:hypothetical protein
MAVRARKLAGAMVCLSALALVGCGQSTGSVKGKVYYQDKALTTGDVTFLGADNQVATARIQSDGSYEVGKVAAGEAKIGVAVSTGKVMVPAGKVMDPAKMGAADKTKEEAPPAVKAVPIPDKYANVNDSGLKYTVKPGPQDFDIKLP